MILVIQYLVLAAIAVNAIAAVKRWRRDRSYPSVFMVIGNVCAVFGFIGVQFFSYSSAGVSTESGAVILERGVWEVPARYLLTLGLVLFSCGFAVESFQAKR
jgi:hypothetical protein